MDTNQRHLDDRHGKGEHEGAERLANAMRHYLSVPDGCKDGGDQQDRLPDDQRRDRAFRPPTPLNSTHQAKRGHAQVQHGIRPIIPGPLLC
jgi:hypothetical protein